MRSSTREPSEVDGQQAGELDEGDHDGSGHFPVEEGVARQSEQSEEEERAVSDAAGHLRMKLRSV
ncbi:MAG: hypothetical protein OXF79_04765 [Chloroflexi bacterium]|nr:hypothetical protein [Chloroflexota bacterium]